MLSFLVSAAGYLIPLNILTWGLFWHDKRQAIRGGRRVPEKTLLTLAAVGGSLAAQHARHHLRHKTQKQPFCHRMAVILRWHKRALALACLAGLIWLGQRSLT